MNVGRCMSVAVAVVAAVVGAARADPPPAWHPVAGQLMTRWAKDVDPAHPLPEYPRPQMVRPTWANLNGLWDYAVVPATADVPSKYAGKILVPFPIESALSGVKRPLQPTEKLVYHRSFTVPADWGGKRTLMHFGAVDYDATVTVNGKPVAHHVGGYDAFEADVTDALKPGANDLIVSVLDPTSEDQPIGKQRLKPDGIFYTGCSGIWQTVWIEPVPAAHVRSFSVEPDVDHGTVTVGVNWAGGSDRPDGNAAVVVVTDSGAEVARVVAGFGGSATFPIPNPHLWTPDDPHLYGLRITFHDDVVDGYFALRKVSLGKDEQGRTRILLNNKFVFERGVLDQGYWPDGIYTAPTDAALRSDIDMTKKLGFNLSRKHAKVEPDRWYYWCDTLGLLVWQDMPQTFNAKLPPAAAKQFEIELRQLVTGLHNHPSIVAWTTFNEGWGEHDVADLVGVVKQMDPTRLVNDASGWDDVKGVGDIRDTHHYPTPRCEPPEPTRASVCGEFGGLGMVVPGHMWTEKAWGYQGLSSDPWHLTRHYQQLMEQAYHLRDDRGMSAFVYTQLTDVETESNGLMTYDRAVVKPDEAIAAAATAGSFPPLPPNPHPELVPTSTDEPLRWRYTTEKPPGAWVNPDFDDGKWKQGRAGFGRGVGGVNTEWTTDDLWLRRSVDLPADVPEDLDVVTFHDEDVQVYVNGVLAAEAAGYTTGYVHLPMTAAGRAAVKPGAANVIAVHCHQTVGGQFIDVGIVAAGKK